MMFFEADYGLFAFRCYVSHPVGHNSWLSASAGCQSCHCATADLCECIDLVCMSVIVLCSDKVHAKLSPLNHRNGSRASYVSIAVRATSHPLETRTVYDKSSIKYEKVA
eukprot:s3524_g11.t1